MDDLDDSQAPSLSEALDLGYGLVGRQHHDLSFGQS